MNLDGKVAVVVGGASGIGLATVKKFAAEGARVAIADANARLGPISLEEVQKEGAENTMFVEIDVRDEASVERGFQQTEEQLGPADILVNCAGIRELSDPLELPIEEWDNVYNVNVRGTFLCCQHAGRQMRAAGKGGAIVNFSSGAALTIYENRPAYTSSKMAVIGLTKSLARDLGPEGIRVNCVCPGIIRTPFSEGILFADEELVKNIPLVVPLGTYGMPEQVADGVFYLVSDLSQYVTGIVLPIDGAHTIIVASPNISQKEGSVFSSRRPPREPTNE